MLALPLAVYAMACGGSSGDDSGTSTPQSDGASSTAADGGSNHDAGPATNGDSDSDAAAGPAGSGTLTASGSLGPNGGAPAAFTFDESVGSRVRMKFGQSSTVSCGDVLLEYVGDHLVAEVVGCSSAQTIDITFDVPLKAGTFPADDGRYPRPMIQLWRASGGNHYVDQGSASYGNRSENKGATLAVSNVTDGGSTLGFELHLQGTVPQNASCPQCAAGGPDVDIDLTLDLAGVPKP